MKWLGQERLQEDYIERQTVAGHTCIDPMECNYCLLEKLKRQNVKMIEAQYQAGLVGDYETMEHLDIIMVEIRKEIEKLEGRK